MFKSALETHSSVDRTTQEHPCHGTAKEVFLRSTPLSPLASSLCYVFATILPLSMTH